MVKFYRQIYLCIVKFRISFRYDQSGNITLKNQPQNHTTVLFQSLKTLGLFKKPGLFDKGLGALLPQAYKKFYKEWKETQPTAVHYIPEEGMFKRDDITGEV